MAIFFFFWGGGLPCSLHVGAQNWLQQLRCMLLFSCVCDGGGGGGWGGCRSILVGRVGLLVGAAHGGFCCSGAHPGALFTAL